MKAGCTSPDGFQQPAHASQPRSKCTQDISRKARISAEEAKNPRKAKESKICRSESLRNGRAVRTAPSIRESQSRGEAIGNRPLLAGLSEALGLALGNLGAARVGRELVLDGGRLMLEIARGDGFVVE
jgi:hypothetical protein